MKPVGAAGLLVDAAAYFREFYRAALRARRSILLSGWQFDSKVALLRGAEADAATAPVTLLAFLNWLCEQKPELRIWILAWDFHLIFAAEREWMQRLAFHWMTNERLHFRFDAAHVARRVGDVRERRGKLFVHAAEARGERPTLVRRDQLAADAIEQAHAERALERREALAHGRGREREAPRRAADPAELGHGQEAAQLVQIDVVQIH